MANFRRMIKAVKLQENKYVNCLLSFLLLSTILNFFCWSPNGKLSPKQFKLLRFIGHYLNKYVITNNTDVILMQGAYVLKYFHRCDKMKYVKYERKENKKTKTDAIDKMALFNLLLFAVNIQPCRQPRSYYT